MAVMLNKVYLLQQIKYADRKMAILRAILKTTTRW